MRNKVDGVYCRKCGESISSGYSWRGYCAICAESKQGGIAPATSELLIRMLDKKNKRFRRG